ncbi:maestro heat-like repeat-containing protein family member 2A isoform 1-T1 [Morphnus guianensis]
MRSTRQTFSPLSGASPFPLQDKQAVLGAVAAMLGVLLHEEQHREHTWEQLLWLLQQYQEVRDTSRVTKSLSYVLEILVGVQTPIPQSTALAISTAVHRQLSDVTEEPGLAQKAVLSRCIMLQGKERRLGDGPPCRGSSLPVLGCWGQLPADAECDFFPAARMRPEETGMFVHSQLSGGSEAGRVAALGLLGVLAHSDGQCHRPGTQGRGWGCWADSRNGPKVVHLHPKGAAKSGSPSRADAPQQGSPPAVRNAGTPGTTLRAL